MQAKAIIELLKYFDWEYASIVHSDSEYGETGYKALKEHVSKAKMICLADPITIYNEIFKEADYIKIIKKLMLNSKTRVVIVFADRLPAGNLLEAAKSVGVKNRFIWIGSDAWASRESVVEMREDIVEGAIAVQPLRMPLPGYDEYFKKLVDGENDRNPWFEEYLQRYHNCSSNSMSSNNRLCNSPFKYSQQLYIHFVRGCRLRFCTCSAQDAHQRVAETTGPKLCEEV